MPLAVAWAGGVAGVDMNADHLAAWRLDENGNPVGEPRRFDWSGWPQAWREPGRTGGLANESARPAEVL